MEKQEVLEEVLKYINVEGLMTELLLDKVIFGKLDELVAKSDNTLDDALVAMLKPELKKALATWLAAKKEEILADDAE